MSSDDPFTFFDETMKGAEPSPTAASSAADPFDPFASPFDANSSEPFPPSASGTDQMDITTSVGKDEEDPFATFDVEFNRPFPPPSPRKSSKRKKDKEKKKKKKKKGDEDVRDEHPKLPSKPNVKAQRRGADNTEAGSMKSKELAPLFDHFLIVRLERFGSGTLTPKIKFKYSAPNSEAVPSGVLSFCFPDAAELRPQMDMEHEHFIFVLTESSGERMYGVCRRFLPVGVGARYPECLVLLSRQDCANVLSDMLETLQMRWIVCPGAVFPLLDAALTYPIPKPGRSLSIRIPGSGEPGFLEEELITLYRFDEHIGSGANYESLFETLDVDSILNLFCALLCEQRVIMYSSNITLLSDCVHSALSLIYPMEWQQVFIPILPSSLLSYVCAPMPFVMGVRAALMPQVLEMPLEDVVLINLDSGEVSCTQNRSGTSFDFPLPDDLTGKIRKYLKNLPSRGGSRAIGDAFLSFIAVLLHHAKFNFHVLKERRTYIYILICRFNSLLSFFVFFCCRVLWRLWYLSTQNLGNSYSCLNSCYTVVCSQAL